MEKEFHISSRCIFDPGPPPIALNVLISFLKYQLSHFQSSVFIKKLVLLSRKDPQKFRKSDFMNIKMVKIDPKSLDIKSLKISAFNFK